jgi:hypothetical protein
MYVHMYTHQEEEEEDEDSEEENSEDEELARARKEQAMLRERSRQRSAATLGSNSNSNNKGASHASRKKPSSRETGFEKDEDGWVDTRKSGVLVVANDGLPAVKKSGKKKDSGFGSKVFINVLCLF